MLVFAWWKTWNPGFHQESTRQTPEITSRPKRRVLTKYQEDARQMPVILQSDYLTARRDVGSTRKTPGVCLAFSRATPGVLLVELAVLSMCS